VTEPHDISNVPHKVAAPRHTAVASVCVAMVLAMSALSYAAVPLYRMFCQATGFGGTTQKAQSPSAVTGEREVTVRFDANVAPGMAWTFEPVIRTVKVKVGENVLAFYTATNTSAHAIKGTASFNVSPDAAGAHFNKIECFCFKEQTLQPGETVEMPVSFFVDPKMVTDRDANWIQEITLSYTFYPSAETG
jgi:cytochrome c oxidase assembly protein subunit 11